VGRVPLDGRAEVPLMIPGSAFSGLVAPHEVTPSFDHPLTGEDHENDRFLRHEGGQAAYFPYAMIAFKALPDLAKISLDVGVLFAISFAVLPLNALRGGSWNIRTHSSAISAIVWVFVVIMITVQLRPPTAGSGSGLPFSP